MSRLIYVPQYPAPMRYQEWHYQEFPKEFSKYFSEVVVLGKKYLDDINTRPKEIYTNNFSPLIESASFEYNQTIEYLNMKLYSDDVLFLTDISYPGFFINSLFHKKPKKCFAFCHATSKNKYDYFEDVRDIKYPIEESLSKLFNVVFVASKYHKKKLGWKNIKVVALPNPPFPKKYSFKRREICSASRPCIQKVDLDLENIVENTFNTRICRSADLLNNEQYSNTWEGYYQFLSESTILLVTAKEETYGYQIVDAILNSCIPLAPNKLSYPELLPKEFLYNDKKDLLKKLKEIIRRPASVNFPKLLNQKLIDNFYKNVAETMLDE